MTKRRVLILGAAGRDFHNFNTAYRGNPEVEVVGFTATQIPKIDGRMYPPELAGEGYPNGIPIHTEDQVEELIEKHNIDEAVFAYSDVSYTQVGNLGSRVQTAGANFTILGTRDTMIKSSCPVVAVTAVRTGCGKSPTSRYVAKALRDAGHRVVAIRHPMPYGDLAKQAVQRFGSLADIDAHDCTFEEREEYESHINEGTVLYAGVDYGAILAEAEKEADIILWDGGNNDWPFYVPDVWISITDPLRAGHGLTYFPGEVNMRGADIVLINKVNTASPEDVAKEEANIAATNPDALLLKTNSVVTVEGDGESLRGKKVLCVEDGPTLTHGGMTFGAGRVAADRYGATVIDPRPHAVGSIKGTIEKYPHVGELLPAMGYYPDQIADLEASINACDCDAVLIGTPFDLGRHIKTDKPTMRVRYEIEDTSETTLASAMMERLAKFHKAVGA
jgi:predicted GTPase